MVAIDIEYMKAIAREAGVAALGRSEGIAYELKADNSYVTAIDRDTEQFVRAKLAERYPDFAFQGEEFGRHGAEGQPLWAVDPIDGTTNMVFGLPYWCVSIGLIADGHPVAGALYMPRTGEMYWGERGKGSYRNGVRLQAPDRDSIHVEDTLGFTSSAVKNLNLSALPGRIRCLGSIAAEVVYAARGALCSHVGCYEGANDLAAALCIAYEAGCEATYLTGEPLQIDDMVKAGKTRAAFVVAPPRMADLIRRTVHARESFCP